MQILQKEFELVVITKQFGNYTGATISTVQLLKRIHENFNRVQVITLKTDGTNIEGVSINVVNNYRAMVSELKKIKKGKKKVVGYSDDHLGFILHVCNIKYLHTYHGNWPDAKQLGLSMFIKSLYFIPLYKLTIKYAEKVISVSKYMNKKFVNKFNTSNTVIYNGVKQNYMEDNSSTKNNKFLMVGNIDKRKYSKAISIFNILNDKDFNKQIDIYGSIVDNKIFNILNSFNFANIVGFSKKISYRGYDALLCTSSSENLPVSIVEAILEGVPVITFNVGGIPEIIKNGKNGYIFKLNETEKFASQVYNFDSLKIPYKDISKSRDEFDWDNSAKKYLRLFNDIKEW